jgi:hypothetical protein
VGEDGKGVFLGEKPPANEDDAPENKGLRGEVNPECYGCKMTPETMWQYFHLFFFPDS